MSLHDPRTLPWDFLLVEWVVIALCAYSFVHARRHGAMLTWLSVLVYGVVIELLSYNFAHNFAHGRFTVSFYGEQLPLYITAVYLVMLYTGMMTARRLGLSPAREAVAAGLCIVLLDVPYDLLGPRLGWWRWFSDDPNVHVQWAGVPVTSFFWHLSFGSILAFLTRRPRSLAWVPVFAIATIVLGTIVFLPFHGAVALGLDDGVFVGAALIAAAVFVLAAAPKLPRDRTLLPIWCAWYGCLATCTLAL
jgi:hypothetical protein